MFLLCASEKCICACCPHTQRSRLRAAVQLVVDSFEGVSEKLRGKSIKIHHFSPKSKKVFVRGLISRICCQHIPTTKSNFSSYRHPYSIKILAAARIAHVDGVLRLRRHLWSMWCTIKWFRLKSLPFLSRLSSFPFSFSSFLPLFLPSPSLFPPGAIQVG